MYQWGSKTCNFDQLFILNEGSTLVLVHFKGKV